MSYLAFDLDALKVVPDAARSAGIPEAQFGYGLVRLWSYCWTTKTENVKAAHLRGFFEAPDFQAVTGSLEAFGFAERTLGDTYRVKGAERYLRVRKAQSEGGKSAVGNLKQSAPIQPVDSPAESPARPDTQPEVSRATSPALTPSSEQRAANTEQRISLRPPEVLAPTTPVDDWQAEDFWRANQAQRSAAGLVPEKWPHPSSLSRWWSEVKLQKISNTQLAQAHERWAAEPFWLKAGLPWAGFIARWGDFVRSEVSSIVGSGPIVAREGVF